MAKKKRRTRKKKRGTSLHGISGSSGKMGLFPCIMWGVGASVLGGLSGGFGASLGVWSAPVGIALASYGFRRNDRIGQLAIAAGVGLVAGTTVDTGKDKGVLGTEDDEDMEGFDLKAMAGRAKAYYLSLGKKFKLPVGSKETTASTTEGLYGDGVNYFVNPYTNSRQIDMSALDRIQSQVEQMTGAVGEIDPAEMNF